MISEKTYFIKLTPLQLYFFGGEQGIVADYYLKGNPLPQQTALLGMIRYQILVQNNLLENNVIIETEDEERKPANWIGEQSFSHEEARTFGKIKSLSQCFLVIDGNKYLPYYPNYFDKIEKQNNNFFLPDYKAKDYYPLRWKNIANDEDFITDFCEEIERVGVDKNYYGQTDERSFYKQVWFKMKKGFSFGFYLKKEEDAVLEDAIVCLGKENAVFQMEVDDIGVSTPPHTKDENHNALYLTSDAFVTGNFLEDCDFAVFETVPFRCLANKTAKKHKHYEPNKSKHRIQLLKRGSVFIGKNQNVKSLIEKLEIETNFRDIGYNSFETKQITIINQ